MTGRVWDAPLLLILSAQDPKMRWISLIQHVNACDKLLKTNARRCTSCRPLTTDEEKRRRDLGNNASAQHQPSGRLGETTTASEHVPGEELRCRTVLILITNASAEQL